MNDQTYTITTGSPLDEIDRLERELHRALVRIHALEGILAAIHELAA